MIYFRAKTEVRANREIDMSRATSSLLLALGLSLTACNESASTVPDSARQTADRLTGDATGSAASNPQCRMFTPAEIAGYGGKPVNAGTNAAMGTGCQWTAKDEQGSVMLQVVDARYHSSPSLAPGYKPLSDVGEKGFVVPETGGWAAGAIHEKKSIYVSTPAGASEANTIAFLRAAMTRANK